MASGPGNWEQTLIMGGPPTFRLDFTPHIGFPTPATPLFGALVGDASPEAQIAFAAGQGFKRVQDPFLAQRPLAAQMEIARAVSNAGLGMGCFVYAPLERASRPQWSARDAASRAELDAEVEAAIAIGRRLGSRHIAVLTGAGPARTRDEQRRDMAANLSRLADRVQAAGMTLCVEAVNAHRLPQMLLHHFADSVEVVQAAAHPAVRLIFDTGHVQAMDGDILGNLDRAWDLIELIQLADHPGRVEPGAGELNFERIIDEIERRGFKGPVELEHGWSAPGAQLQSDYLKWLGRWASQDRERTDGGGA